MNPLVYIPFATLLGLAIGSFLNVVIDRLPAERSIMRGRSQCDACGHPLSPLDLVPLVSYLALKGRCRYCGTPIPRRILAIEAANGALYAFTSWQLGPTPLALITMAFASVLLVVFVIDLEHHLILDAVTYPGVLIAAVAVPWGPVGEGTVFLQAAYTEALYGFVLGGLVLLVIYLLAFLVFRREALGLGDVKLGALMGLMLGFRGTVVALDLAFIIGGVVALGLWLKKVRRPGQYIPFGPFLAGAAIVALFWGKTIFNWYWSFFS